MRYKKKAMSQKSSFITIDVWLLEVIGVSSSRLNNCMYYKIYFRLDNILLFSQLFLCYGTCFPDTLFITNMWGINSFIKDCPWLELLNLFFFKISILINMQLNYQYLRLDLNKAHS